MRHYPNLKVNSCLLQICGRGVYKREQAQAAQTPLGQEDSSQFSHTIAQATVNLFNEEVSDVFVITGGTTGGTSPEGELYRSEATLIEQEAEQLGVPADRMVTEKRSLDTVQNIVNAANEFDIPLGKSVNTLAAKYHSQRVGNMMKLFAFPVENAFAAEEVMRREAQRAYQAGEISDKEYNKKLSDIEGTVDLVHHDKNSATFYDQQKGTEKRKYDDRLLFEAVWTSETLTYPARILAPAADLVDDDRVREVVRIATNVYSGARGIDLLPYDPDDSAQLRQQKDKVNLRRQQEIDRQNKMYIESYGFDLEKDSADELRAKMRKQPWPFLTPEEKAQDVEEWKAAAAEGSGWNPLVEERLQRLQEYQLPHAG